MKAAIKDKLENRLESASSRMMWLQPIVVSALAAAVLGGLGGCGGMSQRSDGGAFGAEATAAGNPVLTGGDSFSRDAATATSDVAGAVGNQAGKK
jgi:hypothetical protein